MKYKLKGNNRQHRILLFFFLYFSWQSSKVLSDFQTDPNDFLMIYFIGVSQRFTFENALLLMSFFSLLMHFLSCFCRLAFFEKNTFFQIRFLPFDFTKREFKKQYLILNIFFTLIFCHANEQFYFFIFCICNRIIYFKFIKGEWSIKLRQRRFLSPLILTLS